MMEPEPLFPRDQYIKILHDLFSTAYGTNGFDTICSVLRVGGMADANWDAFAESRIAFDDYNWILDQVSSEKGATAARRFSLLMYCQAVEMSGAQEIIANLLRCTLKRAFVIDPFFDPWKRRKKNPLFRPPPSATTKYNRIRALATECKRDDLVGALDAFFDERIRNAFSHSDYIITDENFRFSDQGIAQQIPVTELDDTIQHCFALFGAFLYLHHQWLGNLGKIKKYHRLPNYEVLELLPDEEQSLHGFRMHFSNGSSATYARRASGVEATNLVFQKDGTVNFMVGLFDALKPEWMIDGKPVTDWSAVP